MRTHSFSALLVLLLASVGYAEPVENPEFASWSKFKPGTSITLKTASAIKDIKSEIQSTTTLVEVGKDKLVVEVATTSKINGMEFKAPATKRDVPRTYDVPKPKDPTATKVAKPEGTVEEGTETLKVGSTEVKAKWVKFKSKTPVGEATGQTWTSDDVPGGMVKMVTTAGDVKTTMELVEIKKP